jgi:alpha-tubulin suppressor-like RCC1 family protein
LLNKEIDPVPVDLDGHDILDVACGKDCLLALTVDHRLFVIGSNRNGQLGLGDIKSVDEWTEVILPMKENAMIMSVHGGYKNSFVVVKNEQRGDKGKAKRATDPEILNNDSRTAGQQKPSNEDVYRDEANEPELFRPLV